MIKLIAIDMDGTLLTDQKLIATEDLEALTYAQNKGVKIVLCTGRPYATVADYLPLFQLEEEDDYLIVYNGALIKRLKDLSVVYKESLSVHDLKIWQKELDRLHLPLNVLDANYVYEPLSYEPGYESIYVGKVTQAPHRRVDFKHFEPDQSFLKFVVSINQDHLQMQLPKINPDFLRDYSVSFSHPFQFEIMKKGVSKGRSLERLGQMLNLSTTNMMAIGDQMNDSDMIELTGIGVAMGNAPESLQKKADFVTSTNNQAGVARAIYQFI